MEMETRPLVPSPSERPTDEFVSRTIRKLDRHLLLLCIGVVFLSYIDRSNVGFAARDLCNELNLTHEEYGLGVSIFYGGYLVSQVLGNALLKWVGAPTWVAFIMFMWGIVAVALGFIQSKAHFYLLRVLLGVAEGGTFPAVYYLLSIFYPVEHLGGAYGVIASAIAFSMPLSSPLSAGLLSLGPQVSVDGWRLLFIVEGILPILYAFPLYHFLPKCPETATFLTTQEKNWVTAGQELNCGHISFFDEVKLVVTRMSWCIPTFCAMLGFGIYSVLMFWATLIIHDIMYGDKEDGDSKTCGTEEGNAAIPILLTAIPYLISGTFCLIMRRFMIRNRTRFSAIIFFGGACALLIWSIVGQTSLLLSLVLLSCALSTSPIGQAHTLSMALSLFDSSTRSTASSLYSMVSSIGGLIFPLIFGKLTHVFGYRAAIALSGCNFLIAAICIYFVVDPLSKKEETRS